MAHKYRPSASVILAARIPTQQDNYDYNLLLFKRTPETAFAPDHFVFPGGVFSAGADESSEWLSHFLSFGFTEEDLHKVCLPISLSRQRPQPLMTSGRNFSREISLRITGIRETFEEVGVLLCRQRHNLNVDYRNIGNVLEGFERTLWQQRVHSDAREFLKMCRSLDVVPDIWALNEWSIWRSPPASVKKYDTIYYFVALDKKPSLLLEPTEVAAVMWQTPNVFLRLFHERLLWLPIMILYEISRLTHADRWSQLLEFARKRSRKGSTLLMLAYYRCRDGLVGTLPGDDCYPQDPSKHIATIEVAASISEFAARSQRLHRVVVRDIYDMLIVSNIPPIDSHLNPVVETCPTRSKL